MTDEKYLGQSVTAEAEALLAAIKRIDVSYGLHWGQKRQARVAKRDAHQLAEQLVGSVRELERRARDAEAGIAVTKAIRAAVLPEEELAPTQVELLKKVAPTWK